jgi:hypothetical protein
MKHLDKPSRLLLQAIVDDSSPAASGRCPPVETAAPQGYSPVASGAATSFRKCEWLCCCMDGGICCGCCERALTPADLAHRMRERFDAAR